MFQIVINNEIIVSIDNFYCYRKYTIKDEVFVSLNLSLLLCRSEQLDGR